MVDELITIDELAERLNISKQQIYKLQREGMPKIKISHKVTRYDWDEVLAWLRDKEK